MKVYYFTWLFTKMRGIGRGESDLYSTYEKAEKARKEFEEKDFDVPVRELLVSSVQEREVK